MAGTVSKSTLPNPHHRFGDSEPLTQAAGQIVVTPDIGQTVVKTLKVAGQFFMSDARQARHCGMQVVDMHSVCDGAEARVVLTCPREWYHPLKW